MIVSWYCFGSLPDNLLGEINVLQDKASIRNGARFMSVFQPELCSS
jgi:hypothetical protein